MSEKLDNLDAIQQDMVRCMRDNMERIIENIQDSEWEYNYLKKAFIKLSKVALERGPIPDDIASLLERLEK